ncbi:unnamed protein product [Paramecium pentaurelia]|uniref:Uncharacterized protein n=1 Tax=Paramecium pentaurelia TaxID=43138 RepID=A0A8S1WJK0_9CILI|nr:unnamed protein product [Paramecium pentaurelia]
MGCCQQIPFKEKESQIVGQISIKEEFSPKALQIQPLSLNLIKGDVDSIELQEKVERLGSTCVDNVLNEKQHSKLENEVNDQFKDEVIINLRQTSNPLQLIRDGSSKNLNKKFIGML